MSEPKYPSQKYPQYSFRIEQDLLDKVEAYCENNMLSKTEFARKAFQLLLASGSDTHYPIASNVVRQEVFDSTIQQLTSKLDTPVNAVPREEFQQLASKVEQLFSKFEKLGELAA